MDPITKVLFELLVIAIKEVPELVREIQQIVESTTMTNEEKEAAYAAAYVKLKAKAELVKKAEL
jgi:hypothetical protein